MVDGELNRVVGCVRLLDDEGSLGAVVALGVTGDSTGGGIDTRVDMRPPGGDSVYALRGRGVEWTGPEAVVRIGVSTNVAGEEDESEIIGRTIAMFEPGRGGDGGTCFETGTRGGGASGMRLSVILLT